MQIFHFTLILQGVQDQKCQKENARTWKGSIFDPTLVKPKWVWEICISVCKISYFPTKNLKTPKIASSLEQAFHGLVDKRLEWYAKGPGHYGLCLPYCRVITPKKCFSANISVYHNAGHLIKLKLTFCTKLSQCWDSEDQKIHLISPFQSANMSKYINNTYFSH